VVGWGGWCCEEVSLMRDVGRVGRMWGREDWGGDRDAVNVRCMGWMLEPRVRAFGDGLGWGMALWRDRREIPCLFTDGMVIPRIAKRAWA